MFESQMEVMYMTRKKPAERLAGKRQAVQVELPGGWYAFMWRWLDAQGRSCYCPMNDDEEGGVRLLAWLGLMQYRTEKLEEWLPGGWERGHGALKEQGQHHGAQPQDVAKPEAPRLFSFPLCFFLFLKCALVLLLLVALHALV